jgi:hypothetical protein
MRLLLVMTPTAWNTGFPLRFPLLCDGFASLPLFGERLGKRDV